MKYSKKEGGEIEADFKISFLLKLQKTVRRAEDGEQNFADENDHAVAATE